jgi:hypothetical protein
MRELEDIGSVASEIGFTVSHAFAHDGGALVYLVAALGLVVAWCGQWVRANRA